MKTNPNEPLNCNNGNGYYNDEFNHTHAGIGLTKREYFAAMAMQGLQASNFENGGQVPYDIFTIAKIAVEQADCLIKALNTETGEG